MNVFISYNKKEENRELRKKKKQMLSHVQYIFNITHIIAYLSQFNEHFDIYMAIICWQQYYY